jgi:hypothetical protein
MDIKENTIIIRCDYSLSDQSDCKLYKSNPGQNMMFNVCAHILGTRCDWCNHPQRIKEKIVELYLQHFETHEEFQKLLLEKI